MKNLVCIDPGTGGGVAFNIRDRVFVYNMPKVPPKATSAIFTDCQVKGVNQIIKDLPSYQVWIEKVGPRPCDTPKTAWRFSANYHCILAALHARWGLTANTKMQLPQHWQAQLGISVPSGMHNYDRRKKLFKAFATEKFPRVTRISFNKYGESKEIKAAPTDATADALCMLWVNAGFGL